jgi:hypothetical protein
MSNSQSYYVASKFERKPQVKLLIHELRIRGETVLGDWTEHTVEGLYGIERTNALRAFALEDQRAVEHADNLVLIHDDHCRGGFTELGIALGKRNNDFFGRPRRVVVIGGRDRAPENGPIFYYLPEVEHFATVTEFLADLDTRISKRG